jgi:F-type H+-transporting ATPase subunit a
VEKTFNFVALEKKGMNMLTFTKGLFLSLLMVVTWLNPVAGQSDDGHGSHPEGNSHAEEKFDAGKFVIEHVLDSYEWHIASVGEKHINIPLPIILFSKYPELHEGRKLHIFMSTKFHHGHEDYRGFRLSHSEEYNGKIVELDAHGHEIGRPLDLSITKVVAGIFVSVIVLFSLLFVAAKTAKRNRGKAPSGIQNLLEPVIVFIRDEIAIPSIGEKKYKKFLPILLSLFFFILLNNLLGLIPIFPFGANVSGNIAVTMVLALFTFAVTNIKGNKHYWKEIFNPDVPWWLKYPIPLMPIVELSGVLTKPFVLMIRLFANMLAGHMIVTVFISLIFIFGSLMGPAAGYGVSPVSMVFSVFILLLDVLVSFIQAYVFTLLSAIYFGMSTAESH